MFAWEDWKSTHNALAGYTLTNEWMPVKPQYKPYCALADKAKWSSEKEMTDDEDAGWGIDKRNQINELNSKENAKFFKKNEEILEPWHPCQKYFTTESNINRPPWTTEFDVMRCSLSTTLYRVLT